MRPRKALIPAAGLGTRFLPATKVVPKELLPVVDRPVLEYVVQELADSGIEEIIFVLSPDKESIFSHFTAGGMVEDTMRSRGQMERLENLGRLIEKVRFRRAYQFRPRGLGHAVLCGADEIGDEPFVVALPDDLVRSNVPCTKQLIDAYEKTGGSVVAVTEVPEAKVSSFGIVAGSGSESGKPFRVEKIVEKPKPTDAPSRLAILGRYILDPAIFSELQRTEPGAIGEIQLTDAMSRLMQTKGLHAVPIEGQWVTTGEPDGYLEANLLYAMDRPDLSEKLRAVMTGILAKK